MKKLFLSLGLSLILLNSCTTRVVSAEKPYTDSAISVGHIYTFFTKDGKKSVFEITKIDAQNIYGKNVEGKEITIEKSNITVIKKSKTGATILLVVGTVSVILVGIMYYKQKPLGDL